MTQQYTQKYTVVCFFEPQEKFSDFTMTDWPLHVTILDTFKTEWQVSELSKALRDIALNTVPFDALPIKSALLGPDKDVPVKLLLLEGGLSDLHHKLLGLVDKGSFIFNTPDFVGEGFLPHATDQLNNKVEIGQKYHLESISLVDMFPNNDYTQRRVIDTFNFRNVVQD
jgi:hypothetical protein